MKDKLLEDLKREETVELIEDHLFQKVRAFGENDRAEYHEEEDCVWFSTGAEVPLFNCVIKTQFNNGEDTVRTRVAEILDEFKQRKVPVLWIRNPSSTPNNLPKYLKEKGMKKLDRMVGMAMDLNNLELIEKPEELVIREADTPELLDAWIYVNEKGFIYPKAASQCFKELYVDTGHLKAMPLYNYVGLIHNKPVSASSLFLADGVAGIYNVATVTERWGRGLARQMTQHALLVARNWGYNIGVLHASTMGKSLYKKMGFKEYCVFDLFTKFYGKSTITIPLSVFKNHMLNQFRKWFF